MSAFLYRLGSLCARMRWLLLAAGLVLCLTTFGAVTNNDLTLPGTGSQQATDLLEAEFPPQQNGGSPIVFHVAKGDVASGVNGTAVKQSVEAILEVPHVYSAPDPTTQAGLVSDDGHTAFSSVLMDIGTAEITPELA